MRRAMLVAFLLGWVGSASGQADPEAAIRALEAREVAAIMADDFPALEGIWDETFVVNAPNNAVSAGRAETIARVRGGVIDYHRFDRVVERVTFNGEVAVAMGAETVVPKAGPQAGQTLRRRYTNVYRRQDDGWRMIARHANLVPEIGQSLDPASPPR